MRNRNVRNSRPSEPWFFRHFNKIFTGVFIFIIFGIFSQIALVGYAAVNVSEQGLKGVAESVWCGSNQNTEECKQSMREAFIKNVMGDEE